LIIVGLLLNVTLRAIAYFAHPWEKAGEKGLGCVAWTRTLKRNQLAHPLPTEKADSELDRITSPAK
jgi:hypothetical protein